MHTVIVAAGTLVIGNLLKRFTHLECQDSLLDAPHRLLHTAMQPTTFCRVQM